MSIQWNGRCDWDSRKAEANRRIHGVAFPEAATVLDDEQALTREDPDARGEVRWVTLGLSCLGRLLVVVGTAREPDTVRLISAWKANPRQRVTYAQDRR